MIHFLGVRYGRGCLKVAIDDGPALGPRAIQQMLPSYEWTMIDADPFNPIECANDRFGENFKIQQKICKNTPNTPHIMIGGDHSVNYGHFVALANSLPEQDLCLIYIDAHLDIHTPETAIAQASGAPHGTNVRALLGDGDARWLTLQGKRPALRPENLFYIGTRSFEPAEIEYARQNNIYIKYANELDSLSDWEQTASEIRTQIGDRPFVVSFDFDAIDPKYFHDVLVPAENGICIDAAKYFINAFKDAHRFEFVEYAPTGDKQSAQIACNLIKILL